MSTNLIVASGVLAGTAHDEPVRGNSPRSSTENEPGQAFADSWPLADLRAKTGTYNIAAPGLMDVQVHPADHLAVNAERNYGTKKALLCAGASTGASVDLEKGQRRHRAAQTQMPHMAAPALSLADNPKYALSVGDSPMPDAIPRRRTNILEGVGSPSQPQKPRQIAAGTTRLARAYKQSVRGSIAGVVRDPLGGVQEKGKVEHSCQKLPVCEHQKSAPTGGPVIAQSDSKSAGRTPARANPKVQSDGKWVVSDGAASVSPEKGKGSVQSNGKRALTGDGNQSQGPVKAPFKGEIPAVGKLTGGQRPLFGGRAQAQPEGHAYSTCLGQAKATDAPRSCLATGIRGGSRPAKEMGVSALKNGRTDGGEHVIASGGSQVRISEPQVTVGQAAKMGQNSSFGHVSQSVGEQIMESLHASTGRGDSQIVIRLNPPELGNVLVKFQQQSDQISGLLEVSSGQTKYEIEQALPQIVRTLQDSGIQVRRLEVVLTDQQSRDTDKGQFQQDGWSGQHDFTPQGSGGQNAPISEWMADGKSRWDSFEPQIRVGQNRIDMLI